MSSEIDTVSQTWLAIEVFANEAIESARDSLEGGDDDIMRGRIELARELLDLATPADVVTKAVPYA